MNILIVDDEPGLAAGLAGWLKEIGWGSPGVATTSDQAIDWINRHGVDVLVCDVAIKPADGFTLRETIQPHFPAMRTIFISGYDLPNYRARMAACQFLPKPVTGEALDTAIRRFFEPKEPGAIAVGSAAKAMPVPTGSGQTAPGSIAASPRVTALPRVVRAVSPPRQAKPRLKAVARPVATPSKPSPPQARTPTVPGWEVQLPADHLVGSTLGNYQVEARIEQSAHGPVYRALQTNFGRQVRLYTLDQNLAQEQAEIEKFMLDASVKANMRHPYVLAVYEAGQSDGIYFYSCEYIPSRSLQSLHDAGISLEERSALQAMKVAAEVLAYFSRENITHNRITKSSILIDANNRIRIANIAVRETPKQFSIAEEMQELGRTIVEVLPAGSKELGVRQFANSLASGKGQGLMDWGMLSQKISSMEPRVAPEDVSKLEAQQRATSRLVEVAKERQRRSLVISSAVSLCLFGLTLGSLWWFVFRPRGGDVRAFNRMIEIPAGEFIYQEGERLSLPAFLIDEYEVTIGQYAAFLEYLEQHPGEAASFNHPTQPKEKSHVPAGWADQDLATGPMYGYYTRAQRWGRYHDASLDVNCPVFGVDWFDAYAYAKWKGRRLPTEQEWEKAARGTRGFIYPWGNELSLADANSGSDFNPDPKKGGERDGYKGVSPVDAKRSDKSPFGVLGTAGNVSEWSASFDTDPIMSSQKVPVIRGGNWKGRDLQLTRRVLTLTDLEARDTVGFRTASDVPAGAKRNDRNR